MGRFCWSTRPQIPLAITTRKSIIRAPLSGTSHQRKPLCRTIRGRVSSPSQMCAFIQSMALPIRTTRYFFRSHRSISNAMISPPTTPKANPGALLPLGQVHWPDRRPSATYQAVAATAARTVAMHQERCSGQFPPRKISMMMAPRPPNPFLTRRLLKLPVARVADRS